MTRRQGRKRKKLLDELKDRKRNCELKEEALDRTMWRNSFARGFGPVVWQITDDDDDDDDDDDKERECRIAVQKQFYLRMYQLYVSAIYRHHQAEYRTKIWKIYNMLQQNCMGEISSYINVHL